MLQWNKYTKSVFFIFFASFALVVQRKKQEKISISRKEEKALDTGYIINAFLKGKITLVIDQSYYCPSNDGILSLLMLNK